MQEAIDQFRANMSRVRDLGRIADALDSQPAQALDSSDVLRAEFVLAVSALDQFAHEVARLGMLEAYRGEREKTPRFLRFQISVEAALQGISEYPSDEWLDEEIRLRNGYRTFQRPDGIAEAMRLVSDVQIWNEVAGSMGMSPQEVRSRLDMIVDRRNGIAHEADVNSTPYGGLLPIDRQITADAVDFIERVGEGIYAAIA